MVNLLTYALGAINLFNSDRPRRQRLDLAREAKRAWRWAKKHPTAATVALGFGGLVILFAILAWGR